MYTYKVICPLLLTHPPTLQCAAVLRWIEDTSKTLPARGYEQAYGIWSGEAFLPILERHLGVTESTLSLYKVRGG